MTNHKSLIRHFLLMPTLLALATMISLPSMSSAQTMAQGNDDVTRGELASFDQFMDSHPEVSEQLRKDPSLVNNKEFVENHPALQEYLQQHPEAREEISENPNRFMHQENRFDQREDQRADRRDNDVTRPELASFDRFMDSHPEVAEQLRKDPSLVNNKEFVENHPGLQEYLQQHPEVREEIRENPNGFMHQERRFDAREDQRADRRDNDVTRPELANFDRFMDSHPEVSEQLRKDPSLVNNKEFVENHPGLQEYLQQHPEVREEIRENPDRFMHQENRFDQREDQRTDRRDNDVTRGELASFDRFMDSHPEVSEQLRKDPSLVNNKEFVENHPGLQEYLQQHPEVREEIRENPNGFMHQERRFDRREDQRGDFREDRRDHDFDRAETETFGRFLGEHSGVASQLSKNPSLANNEEFVESHPDLQQFLKEHPGAQKQLMANPQSFIQSAQQFTNSTSAPKTPVLNPQLKPQK